MLNGHFLDSLRSLFAKGNNEQVLNRMQVVFGKDVSRTQTATAIDTLAALDHVSLAF
jgi:hypothetical protein